MQPTSVALLLVLALLPAAPAEAGFSRGFLRALGASRASQDEKAAPTTARTSTIEQIAALAAAVARPAEPRGGPAIEALLAPGSGPRPDSTDKISDRVSAISSSAAAAAVHLRLGQTGWRQVVHVGTLHLVRSCSQCGRSFCDSWHRNRHHVEEGYSLGAPLEEWGCQHLNRSSDVYVGCTGVVRNRDTGATYVLEAPPSCFIDPTPCSTWEAREPDAAVYIPPGPLSPIAEEEVEEDNDDDSDSNDDTSEDVDGDGDARADQPASQGGTDQDQDGSDSNEEVGQGEEEDDDDAAEGHHETGGVGEGGDEADAVDGAGGDEDHAAEADAGPGAEAGEEGPAAGAGEERANAGTGDAGDSPDIGNAAPVGEDAANGTNHTNHSTGEDEDEHEGEDENDVSSNTTTAAAPANDGDEARDINSPSLDVNDDERETDGATSQRSFSARTILLASILSLLVLQHLSQRLG